MDIITKKDIARYSLIAIIVFLITLGLVIILNSAAATALFWATNILTPWTIELNLQNALAGGILLTILNAILHNVRGGE